MALLHSVPFHVAMLAASAALATAQCPLQWLAAGGLTSPANRVHATVTWDPDGAGPQPTVVSRFAYDGDQIWADLSSSNGSTKERSGVPVELPAATRCTESVRPAS